MKPANPHILTINGGSSSIKFALFEAGDSLRRILSGRIERIELPEATVVVKSVNKADNFTRPVWMHGKNMSMATRFPRITKPAA